MKDELEHQAILPQKTKDIEHNFHDLHDDLAKLPGFRYDHSFSGKRRFAVHLFDRRRMWLLVSGGVWPHWREDSSDLSSFERMDSPRDNAASRRRCSLGNTFGANSG